MPEKGFAMLQRRRICPPQRLSHTAPQVIHETKVKRAQKNFAYLEAHDDVWAGVFRL